VKKSNRESVVKRARHEEPISGIIPARAEVRDIPLGIPPISVRSVGLPAGDPAFRALDKAGSRLFWYRKNDLCAKKGGIDETL
jgi:hypothetical protein